jgi:hypothetical protein
VSWFSKPAVEVEPEAAVDPRFERLAQIEGELPLKIAARDQIRKEVRDLRLRVKDPRVSILSDGLYTAIGAMKMETPHALLESLQRKADAEVEALLREKAMLEHPGLIL